MSARRQTRRALGPLVLFALFAAVLLVSLIAGIRVYSALAGQEEAIRAERFGTGFLVNSIRGADARDGLRRVAGPEGDALVLREATPAGDVETRFYLHDGTLMQEYTMADAPFDPVNAVEVMSTNVFAFSFADGLLTVTTDEGDVCIALRSHEVGL